MLASLLNSFYVCSRDSTSILQPTCCYIALMMHHCTGSLCLFVCLFSSSCFFFFFFFISYLAPSPASSVFKRTPNTRSIVTTVSVLELCKQHSYLSKYRKPQSLHRSQGDASLYIVPVGVWSELSTLVKPVRRVGYIKGVQDGTCSLGVTLF